MVDEVKTNALFYLIHKGTVSTEDYVNWSHYLLENEVSSTSAKIISSFSFDDSIFEVEVFFKRALNELEIRKPTFEVCSRAYICHLADKIKQEDNHLKTFDLAYVIFHIVSDLHYPDDLLEWYELSEAIDELRYGDTTAKFNRDKVITRIKNEANVLLGLSDK